MQPINHLTKQLCIVNFPNSLFQQSTAQGIRQRNPITDLKQKTNAVKNIFEEQLKGQQKEMIKNRIHRTIKSFSQEKFSKQRCKSLRVLNKQSLKDSKGKFQKCEIEEVNADDKIIKNEKVKGNQVFMKQNTPSENKNYSLECNKKRKKFNFLTVQQHQKAQAGCHQHRYSNFQRTKSSNEIGKIFESDFDFPKKQKIISHVEKHLKDHCTGQCCLQLNQMTNKKTNKNWFQKFLHKKPAQETGSDIQQDDNLNNYDILNEQNSFELIKQSLHPPMNYQNVGKNFYSEKKIGFSFSCENRFKQSISTTCAVQTKNLIKYDKKIYNDNVAFGANRNAFRDRVSTKVKEPLGKFYSKFESGKHSTNSAILLKSNQSRFPNQQKKYFGPDFYDLSNKQNFCQNNLPCHYFLSQIPKGTLLPKEDNRNFYSQHPPKEQKKTTISKAKFKNQTIHEPTAKFMVNFQNQIPKNTLGKKQRKVNFPIGLKNKKYESSTTNVSPRKIEKWIPTYSTVGKQQNLIIV